MRRITSRQDAVVRRFRSLARRREADQVLLDGEHLVGEAFSAGVRVEIVVTDGLVPGLVARASEAGTAVYQASASVLKAASPVRSPTGVVAIARWRPHAVSAVFDAVPHFVVGLLDIQDPGNVGSVIRSADALGASAVAALDGTVDPGNWKALRGAMGGTFRVPVARGALSDAIAEARLRDVAVAVAVGEGGTPLGDADLSGRTLLLLGNEGAGLSPAAISAADRRITIPMRSGVDSLNVGVTAALVLWEAMRRAASPNRGRSLLP